MPNLLFVVPAPSDFERITTRSPLSRALALVILVYATLPATAGDTVAQDENMAAFEAHAARLQTEGGTYNPPLAEVLTGLGRAQRDAGLYAAAAATLERALHVARVNEGLHNPAQLPLRQLLLEVHTALGDAEAVDRDYQQIFWVRKRHAGSDRAALLPIIEEIGRERLRVYEIAPPASGLEHLVKADALYDLARGIAKESGTAAADVEITLLYHAAMVNHRLALEMRRSRVGFHDLRAVMIGNGREVFEVYEEQARETLFQSTFLKGEWLAREAVARATERAVVAPVALAEALNFLGDYYLSFRRTMDAMQEYRRAMEVLQRHGLADQVDRLFGVPVLVTTLRAPGDDAGLPAAGDLPSVDVLLDVGADGWPGNVRVQQAQPAGDPGLGARGARAMLAWRYRPRFVAGQPAPALDIPARYVFLD